MENVLSMFNFVNIVPNPTKIEWEKKKGVIEEERDRERDEKKENEGEREREKCNTIMDFGKW